MNRIESTFVGHCFYVFLVIILPFLLASASIAMDGFDIDDIGYYAPEHSVANNAILSPPLITNSAIPSLNVGKFAQLQALREKFETERISLIFANLDDLFSQAVIRLQTIDEKGQLGPAQTANLHYYLSGPHEHETIVKMIEKNLRKKLSSEELELLKLGDELSFSVAVRALWKKGIIAEKRAKAFLNQASPMTSEEIVRLLENGAVETAKGYLIQLRTGASFGDPLKLFDDISRIVKRIREQDSTHTEATALSRLLERPLQLEVLDIFELAGLTPEETISDANVIREIRSHFLMLNNLGTPVRFNQNLFTFTPTGPESAPEVNTESGITHTISPSTLSASLVGNYYFSNINASTTHGLFVNPLGITYAGMLTFSGNGLDWWLNYSSGYLGAGFNYTTSFDQGTFWSNGDPTYLNVGIMAGGWNNYLTGGISLSTVLANGVGVGATATMTVTRSHDVSYLGTEPFDSMIPSIRGLHKIEIDDLKGIAGAATIAMNFSAVDVPVTIAFRAGAEHTTRRVYRTHADFANAQRMLSEADVPGVLYLLGKRIKETRVPSFEHPEQLIDGDELVEVKIGKLNGAFVVGLESLIPIHALRIGAGIELTAEYELGLKKFSNNKFEVSIQPKRVYEMGLFGSILNVAGVGHIKSFAVAKKQIFAFDFNYPEAILAFQDLIHHGNLPISEEIPVYTENRGPEYLLSDFRAQNEMLAARGIARTYLEKIDIEISKWHAGVDVPILPAILDVVNKVDEKTRKTKPRLDLQFSGLHREFMSAESKSLATNGITAIRRSTFGGRKSKGQGFSGIHNEDVFVTHERVHSLDVVTGINTWGFGRLVIHAQLEDSRITGNEENQMVERINKLFSTFIGEFQIKNSKAPRLINIERALTDADLHELTQNSCRDRVGMAAQRTGIDPQKITAMLKALKKKHPDYQSLVVKHFIETSSGISGFAAIHQLLGAKPDQIYVRTESGYGDEILKAKKFIIEYSKAEQDQIKKGPFINVDPFNIKKQKKHVKHFYEGSHIRLREIDDNLRRLRDDKFLIDEKSSLHQIYPDKEKVRQLVSSGLRQDKEAFRTGLISARQTILEMRDLQSQGFNREDQKIIYQTAGKKRIGIRDAVHILLIKYEGTPMSIAQPRKYLKKRIKSCEEMMIKLNDRINALEKDEVMIAMDESYVYKTIRDFSRLRKRLADVISVKHLEPSEREQLNKKLSRRKSRWPFWSKKRVIAGGIFSEVFSQPMVCDHDCVEEHETKGEGGDSDHDVMIELQQTSRSGEF